MAAGGEVAGHALLSYTDRCLIHLARAMAMTIGPLRVETKRQPSFGPDPWRPAVGSSTRSGCCTPTAACRTPTEPLPTAAGRKKA